jgi:WD40 repeat protein
VSGPGKGGAVYLLGIERSQPPRVLERIADMMLVVRFSPDGTLLAAGGADNAIHIYNMRSGQREQLIEQHADWITDLAFSPDGSKLASASRDKTARIFDVKSGSMETAYLGHTEGLLCVAWSPDGRELFTGGQDRAIHCWRASDAKLVGKIDGFGGDLYKLQMSADRLLCCGSDGGVREYTVGDRKLGRTLCDHGDWAYSMSIDPQAGRIAVGGYGGEIKTWDLASGRALRRFIAAPGN